MSHAKHASTSFGSLSAFCALFFCLNTMTFTVQAQSLPKIDFNALGQIAIAGNFAALQLYDPSTASSSNSITPPANTSSFLSRSQDGTMRILASTNTGGSVNAICVSNQGTVYVAGDFSTIGNTTASNIASYTPSSSTWSALGSGLDDAVQSLYCDDDQGTLYAGGNFTGYLSSWPYSAGDSWSQPALALSSLNGPVQSIQAAGSGSSRSLFLGGTFSYSITNTTSGSSSAVDVSTTPSLGSSLTPIALNTPQSYTWAGPQSPESDDPTAVFCPEGDGLTGTSWLSADNQQAIFVVRLYTPQQVGGIRIGNTFKDNRGTRQFKIISVPDSIVQPLQYYSDPYDPTSELIDCQWECPLIHNTSVPYQDFLFPNGTSMTGFQINIDNWYGNGGGLHQLSLLSNGAYSFADEAQNEQSSVCSSGIAAQSASSSSTSGTWTQESVPSTISGVAATALQATVPVGTSASSSPSLTFAPAISADGQYTAYLLVPGCGGDCAARTTVDVITNPGQGASSTTTINQNNAQDASIPVYTGSLSPGATFEMRLSSNPSGSGSGGNYQLVATKLQLVAASTDGRAVATRSSAYGLLEFVPSGSSGVFGDGAASAASTPSTSLLNATSFADLAVSLTRSATITAMTYADSTVFFGGSFAANGNISTANIASFGGSSTEHAVPAGGLNGPVHSLVAVEGWLYAGGNFSASADGSVTGLNNVAKWHYSASGSTWQAMSGGAVPEFYGNGVTDLSLGESNGNPLILCAGAQSGLAVYNTETQTWDASSGNFLLGSLTALSQNDDDLSFAAGEVTAAYRYASPALASLRSNGSGYPEIVPYSFSLTSNASSTTSTNSSALSARLAGRSFWNRLRARQTITVQPPATSLPSIFATGDENRILTGAYWRNGSDQVVIMGGDFLANNSVRNIGAFNARLNSISPLNIATVNGPVTSLLVSGDVLFAGGNFTLPGEGFLSYDLKRSTMHSDVPALQAYDNSNATVNALLPSPLDGDHIIVAGAFRSAGDVTCNSICLWSKKDRTWTALGNGLPGAIGALVVAGDSTKYLFAAGSFAIGEQPAYVARYNFEDSTWSNVGLANHIPGPATALSSDDHDENKIYIAGSNADGSQPYVRRWNGTEWLDAGSSDLASSGGIQQLTFVPLSTSGDNNDVMNGNRRLLASGSLNLHGYGEASSALYDGQSWIPFITTATSDGSAGGISSFFSSVTNFSMSKHYLSVGIVVLISIAIALGIVFLLVLIGVLVALWYRHKDQQREDQSSNTPPYEEGDEKTKHRPTSLLATLNAATAMMAADNAGQEKKGHHSPTRSAPYEDTHSMEEDLGAAAVARHHASVSQMDSDSSQKEDEEHPVLRTRYSFHKEETGEIDCEAGEEVLVLDRTDESWWFVQRARDGARGVIPSSYLF